MGYKDNLTEWGFGQYGSTYLNGDGAKLQLNHTPTSKYYICAITMTEDTTFQHLEVLDGGEGRGIINNSSCVSTDGPYPLDTDWAGTAGTDTTNETNEDSDQVTTSHIFPRGITMYGFWDLVELNSGACIVYIAPR